MSKEMRANPYPDALESEKDCITKSSILPFFEDGFHQVLLDRGDAQFAEMKEAGRQRRRRATLAQRLHKMFGLPRPAAFVGYSPQLSLDADRHDPKILKHDAYQPLSAVRRAKTRWLIDDVELSGSRTPIEAPITAFPPTFLTVAERELLEPDILALTELLHQAGTPVQTHRWRRQVHAFPVLAGVTPESAQAVQITTLFLEAAFDARLQYRAA